MILKYIFCRLLGEIKCLCLGIGTFIGAGELVFSSSLECNTALTYVRRKLENMIEKARWAEVCDALLVLNPLLKQLEVTAAKYDGGQLSLLCNFLLSKGLLGERAASSRDSGGGGGGGSSTQRCSSGNDDFGAVVRTDSRGAADRGDARKRVQVLALELVLRACSMDESTCHEWLLENEHDNGLVQLCVGQLGSVQGASFERGAFFLPTAALAAVSQLLEEGGRLYRAGHCAADSRPVAKPLQIALEVGKKLLSTLAARGSEMASHAALGQLGAGLCLGVLRLLTRVAGRGSQGADDAAVLLPCLRGGGSYAGLGEGVERGGDLKWASEKALKLLDSLVKNLRVRRSTRRGVLQCLEWCAYVDYESSFEAAAIELLLPDEGSRVSPMQRDADFGVRAAAASACNAMIAQAEAHGDKPEVQFSEVLKILESNLRLGTSSSDSRGGDGGGRHGSSLPPIEMSYSSVLQVKNTLYMAIPAVNS